MSTELVFGWAHLKTVVLELPILRFWVS